MITTIPKSLFGCETEGRKAWNSPPHPAHSGLVPCEEFPLKSSWLPQQSPLWKTKVIHQDRGMTESKSDSKKCKKGGNEVFVQFFKLSFQVSCSLWRIYLLPLTECDVERSLEEGWVKIEIMRWWNYTTHSTSFIPRLSPSVLFALSWKRSFSTSWQTKQNFPFPKAEEGMEKAPRCLQEVDGFVG